MIKVKTVDQNKADSDVTPALRHQSIRYFTLLNQPPPPPSLVRDSRCLAWAYNCYLFFLASFPILVIFSVRCSNFVMLSQNFNVFICFQHLLTFSTCATTTNNYWQNNILVNYPPLTNYPQSTWQGKARHYKFARSQAYPRYRGKS